MEKLDLKDRKILYHLDFDSRQSFRSIGKKVGLSKDVVASRVKKLQDKGIIKDYYAVIDYAKLGYSLYRFYFSFQNVTPDLKKEIINYFVNDKYTDSVFSLEGNYDLLVFIVVKNFPDAHSFWYKTLKLYGKHFSKKVFTAYCQEDYYGYSFLLDKKDYYRKIIYQWYDSGKKDNRTKYVKVKPKSIVDSIEQELIKRGVKLNPINKIKLDSIFMNTNLIEYASYVIKMTKQRLRRQGNKNPIIDSFEPIKYEIGEICLYALIFLRYLKEAIGLKSREFRRYAKISFNELLKARVTKKDVAEVLKEKVSKFSDEFTLDKIRYEFENLVYAFIELGVDFLTKLSYLQPYRPEMIIAKSHFIMSTFETIDEIKSKPEVQALKKQKKKI